MGSQRLPITIGWSALTVYLGFQAGGFFADSTAVASLALAAVLLVRATVIARPFAGIGPVGFTAVAAMVLYALWTLASASWSHAAGRALIEFDRALLYALALVLFASAPRDPWTLRALVRGAALGGLVLCAAGLITRTLPRVFPISAGLASERLSYPLTYWNGLGLLATVTALLLLGISASAREPRAIRALAAGAVPIPAATMLLTFSRGAMATCAIGLLVLVTLGRPRRLLSTLLSAIPAAAVAIIAAYEADALGKPNPTGAAAVSQGRVLIVIVGACCVGALALRAMLGRWADARLQRPTRLWSARKRTAVGLAMSAGAAAMIGVALAAGAGHAVSQEYHRFLKGTSLQRVSNQARLFDPSNNGRLEHWRVAVDAFARHPLHGSGAGTYQLLWSRYRRLDFYVVNAHSLYLEVMAELGLVGLVLLLITLAVILVMLVRRLGIERPFHAAVLAGLVAWSLEAGIDWIWQLPAVTAWVFAAGGAVLARRDRPDEPGVTLSSRPFLRLIVGLAIVLVALTPARVGLSQLRLNQSVTDFRTGNCGGAVQQALQSLSALGSRAEPYEVLSYCDGRAGLGGLAATMALRAVQRDPQNWEYHYDLALVRGAFGVDPRPQAALALELNPLANQTRDLVRTTRSTRRQVWETACRRAPLLIS